MRSKTFNFANKAVRLIFVSTFVVPVQSCQDRVLIDSLLFMLLFVYNFQIFWRVKKITCKFHFVFLIAAVVVVVVVVVVVDVVVVVVGFVVGTIPFTFLHIFNNTLLKISTNRPGWLKCSIFGRFWPILATRGLYRDQNIN